jgi:hypothetical protein
MTGPALVFVHGRSQQMPAAGRGGPVEEAAFVLKKKKGWLAGLTKGLVLAGLPAVDEAAVHFPYFGNVFVDAIAARERAGFDRPELEMAVDLRPPSAEALILDHAQLLGFTPEREAAGAEPGADDESAAWRSYAEGNEVDFGPILRPRLLRSALQYVARKTGAGELVIERFLTDVAYYLDVEEIRRLVLDVVAGEVRKAAAEHGSVIVVAHSLGSCVGFDLFDALDDDVEVPLFVTTGSPLGLPVVMRNLRPVWRQDGAGRPAPARAGTPVPWLNAFDVRDFVALVHPLGNFYAGVLADERTFNPSDPHSIQDYLADPDVARPIGRVLAGRAPW